MYNNSITEKRFQKLTVMKNIKSILKISVPAAFEQLLLIMTGVINMMIVGRINNDVLIAVSTCTQIFNIIQAVFTGLSVGAAVKIARSFYINKVSNAEKTMYHIVIINIVLGILFSTLLFFEGEPILSFLFSNVTEEIIVLMNKYIMITLMCIPFMGIDCAISASLRGAGDAKTPFLLTFVFDAVNVFLAYFFVYILKLGITGIALSFLVSKILVGISKLIMVSSQHIMTPIKLNISSGFSFTYASDIFSYGSITMIEQLSLQMSYLGMQIITTHISSIAMGAYQIANSTINIVYSITAGFEAAAITIVGSFLGKGDSNGARSSARSILFLTEFSSVLTGALMFIFSSQFMSLFSNDTELIGIGIKFLRILIIYIPLTSLFQGVAGTIKTGGKSFYILIFNTVGPWFIRLPFAYYLCVVRKMDIYGLMAALFLDYTFRAVLNFVIYKRNLWMSPAK